MISIAARGRVLPGCTAVGTRIWINLGTSVLRNLVQIGLRPIAFLLIATALLVLMASWWPAPGVRNPWISQRPLALFLLGLGALMMWFRTRTVVRRPPRGFELSTFKHSTLAEDLLGPDTHPVGPPDSAFSDFQESASTAAATKRGPAPANAPKLPTRWRAGVFRSIEWQRFEAVCAALFRQDGYTTKLHSHGAGGGVEIWLHSPLDLKHPVRIVLCKHVGSQPVSVAEVQEFQQTLANAKVPSGAFVTAGSFTDEAKQFARRNHISPVDSANLLTVILRRSEAQQQELLAIATQGEYWRPTCPGCHAKMVARTGEGEAGTWGCPVTPPCPTVLTWTPEQP